MGFARVGAAFLSAVGLQKRDERRSTRDQLSHRVLV